MQSFCMMQVQFCLLESTIYDASMLIGMDFKVYKAANLPKPYSPGIKHSHTCASCQTMIWLAFLIISYGLKSFSANVLLASLRFSINLYKLSWQNWAPGSDSVQATLWASCQSSSVAAPAADWLCISLCCVTPQLTGRKFNVSAAHTEHSPMCF